MKTSELAWKLDDYRTSDVTPPERVISHPLSTEGEMMTDEEVEEFIKDSIATLRILSDRSSKRYTDLYEHFCLDLAYLKLLGRIEEDDYNELTHPDNLRF